jgi:AGZA family xanthine/uracil permease-like MFS transporter
VARRAGLLVEGKMERLNKALLVDSGAIVAGSVLGTSSTTAYIESAAGVQVGGRTGLTALTVAALFLACLFIAPLASVVPPYATAPALLFVACLMLADLGEVDWSDTTESIPAAVTALGMPFTYSIAEGIAFGFISYAVLKLLTGRARDVKPVVWVIAALFAFKIAYVGA